MTRQFLVDSVWGPDSSATGETLKQQVKNLRKKLGAAGDKIEAVVSYGYKFIP